MKATFEALKKLYSDGLIKGVGVSNFAKKHLDKAGAYAVQEKNDAFVKKVIGDLAVTEKMLSNYLRSK